MQQIKRFIYSLIEPYWNIAFFDNSVEGIIKGEKPVFHLLKHNYEDRWFADPFVLDVTEDTIILLVEDFRYSKNRAGISKMVIDRKKYQLLSLKSILELETHLSFPFIIRDNGHIYICPENSDANELSLYDFDAENEIINKIKELSHLSLADAVISHINGKTYMFATSYPNHNGKFIEIYEYLTNTKTFELIQTYQFDEKIGRNAGDIFYLNNKLYRPAQDCGLCYGHGISIQEISINEGKFSFNEVRRIYPPNKFKMMGTHTFNSYKGVLVGDALLYKHPLFGSTAYFMKEKINIKL